MSQDNALPPGAGTTTRPDSEARMADSGRANKADRNLSTQGSRSAQPSSETGTFQQDEHESGYRRSGRGVVVRGRADSGPRAAVVVGAALAGAVIGGALPFMFPARSSKSHSRRESAVVQESVTIKRPAQELYAFWRDFTNLPQFMDNIKSVARLSDKRSHWVIKAPAGTSVEFDSVVIDDVPGRLIAWQSEGGATVPNRGRVEFEEISSGVTLVRATISYDPPAGEAGRLIAKLFQREPGAQARQDLARFKEVMEGR